jgi:hypothetical protein
VAQLRRKHWHNYAEIATIFTIKSFRLKKFAQSSLDSSGKILTIQPKRAIHNGILLAPLGTLTNQVNGISISSFMSRGDKINGFTFNLIWGVYADVNGISAALVNHSLVTKGIQLGIINKTYNLKGIQLGLWNTNEKRRLPIVNWNF